MGKGGQVKVKHKERRRNETGQVKGGGRQEGELSDEGVQGTKEAKSEKDEKRAARKKKEKATPQGAKKVLHGAVNGEVKKQGKMIATSLVQSTIDGDARTATMMLSLMEERNESKDEKRHGLSVADLLEAEPEWDESMDESCEADLGGREATMQETGSSE